MATLTDEEKRKIRNAAERKANANSVSISWVKGAVNDAAQAIEDAISAAAFQTQVSSDIDTATSSYGVTFTNQEKKWLFAFVCEHKFRRDG
jgi:hypothetical protein